MITRAEDRMTRPMPLTPDRKSPDEGGPGKPDVQRPDTRELLKRMKRVDPDAARRYRQRSGQ